jgi:hypothetical protein
MQFEGRGKLLADGVECGAVDYALETWVRGEQRGAHGTIEPDEASWKAILNAYFSDNELILELKTGHHVRLTVWRVDKRVRAHIAVHGEIPNLKEIN